MTDDDDEILSAEIALGLLDGPEGAAARRRAAADPALATRVDWWQEQFAALVEDGVEPGPSLWPRITAALPPNDNAVALVGRWRATAIAAMLVAVVLGTSLALRPAPPAPISAPVATPVLLASLTGERGVLATIAYNAAAGRLTIVPGELRTGAGDAELWIIPAGGTAHSLGTIDPAKATTTPARADARQFIGTGATFAITLEQRGGSPTGQPQGPIVASAIIAGA